MYAYRLWPQYVRDRVSATYTYLGGGLILTAVCAMGAARTPAIMKLVSRNSMLVAKMFLFSLI